MSLLDAFDLVVGIDTEYVSGENVDGVPYDENAVLSYQAFYFHPATGKSNGGYYITNGPRRRHRHALTSLYRASSTARSATVSTSMATGRPTSRKHRPRNGAARN